MIGSSNVTARPDASWLVFATTGPEAGAAVATDPRRLRHGTAARPARRGCRRGRTGRRVVRAEPAARARHRSLSPEHGRPDRAREGTHRERSDPQEPGLEDEPAFGRDRLVIESAVELAVQPGLDGVATTRPGEGERQPAQGVRQVRSEVVRLDRPGRGQPEQDGERETARCREPEQQATQRSEADRDLGDGDEQTDRHRERLAEHLDERGDRRDLDEPVQLRADRSRAGRLQEVRIGQLVDAGIDERHAQEGAEGKEGERETIQLCRRVGRFGRPGVASRRAIAGPSGTVADRCFALRAEPVTTGQCGTSWAGSIWGRGWSVTHLHWTNMRAGGPTLADSCLTSARRPPQAWFGSMCPKWPPSRVGIRPCRPSRTTRRPISATRSALKPNFSKIVAAGADEPK